MVLHGLSQGELYLLQGITSQKILIFEVWDILVLSSHLQLDNKSDLLPPRFQLNSRSTSQELPHFFTEHKGSFSCSQAYAIWLLPWADWIHILPSSLFKNNPACLHSMLLKLWVALPNRQRSTLKSTTTAFICNYCVTALDSAFTHRLGWSIRSGALSPIPSPQPVEPKQSPTYPCYVVMYSGWMLRPGTDGRMVRRPHWPTFFKRTTKTQI
jgi:hypothetical protein